MGTHWAIYSIRRNGCTGPFYPARPAKRRSLCVWPWRTMYFLAFFLFLLRSFQAVILSIWRKFAINKPPESSLLAEKTGLMTNDQFDKLIIGCKKGDQACFSELIDIYGKRIWGYFYRLTTNADLSEDLLSELFVKLVQKIKTYRGGSFDSWIFTIASNIFHDYLRSKQRQQRLIDEKKLRLETQITADSKDDQDPRADKLQSVLARLDEDVRDVIMLRFYSQLGFKEIAAIRGEPIGTTLSKVHRGLKKLRELMELQKDE